MSVKTNIVLTNLNERTLEIILSLCEKEKINYTFDKDYYDSETFDINKMLECMIKKNKQIPLIYKSLIENDYVSYLEDIEDEIALKRVKQIEYI